MKFNFNQLKNFTLKQIKCGTAVDVKIFDGESEYVEIFCSDRDFKKLEVVTTDDSIEISAHIFASLDKLEIEVSASNLQKITASGLVALDCCKTAEVCKTVLSGGISASFHSVDTKEVTFCVAGGIKLVLNGQFEAVEVSSAGNLKLGLLGKCKSAILKSSGAANIDGEDFDCQNMTLNCSGSSKIVANVTDTLTFSLSGAGRLNYTGNPKTVNCKTAGAVVVKKE